MSGVHSATNLDRYVPGASVIHRADPVVKLLATLGFIVVVATVPPGAWAAFAMLYGVVWTAVLLSGIGPLRILRRSMLVLPFILLPLPSMFTKPGEPLFDVPLGVFTLTATDSGAVFVASVMLKSWASVTAAALYTATTPFLTTLETLRTLRVPAVLVAIVSFMYRYLFLLVDEAERLIRARAARCGVPMESAGRTGGGIRWRAGVAGGMAGSLFVRTYERSERVYFAMLARGFDGSLPAPRRTPSRLPSLAVGAGALSLLVLLGTAARMMV